MLCPSEDWVQRGSQNLIPSEDSEGALPSLTGARLAGWGFLGNLPRFQDIIGDTGPQGGAGLQSFDFKETLLG